MNKVTLCWLAFVFYWCEGFGQTNSPIPLTLFSMPHLGVKSFECEPETSLEQRRSEASEPSFNRDALIAASILADASAKSSRAEVTLNSPGNADFFQKLDIYRRLDREGYLIRPERRDSLLESAMDSMYRPELFYAGHTTIRCSLLSAIKHKNPLWLLNLHDPEYKTVFFQWSW